MYLACFNQVCQAMYQVHWIQGLRCICILNPNLSVAPGVSKGFATDLALVALCINVASQQAGKGKECVINLRLKLQTHKV